jgi:hypothetical protein
MENTAQVTNILAIYTIFAMFRIKIDHADGTGSLLVSNNVAQLSQSDTPFNKFNPKKRKVIH